MPENKPFAPARTALPYKEEMAQLRAQMDGEPYAKGVAQLLPHVTKSTIRNAVNGRSAHKLVLSAMRLLAFKHLKEKEQAEKNLAAVAEEWGAPV